MTAKLTPALTKILGKLSKPKAPELRGTTSRIQSLFRPPPLSPEELPLHNL